MTADSSPKLEHSRTWFLAGLALVFLRALPNLRYPLHSDQATYCLIGQGLLRGQLLYRDLWDNKPPGIFYIYALIVKIVGPVMWCVGVVDILWLLIISVCIFYFARRFMGPQAATLAMVFNAARHCQQGYINAAQPEAFLMLCVFAAWFLLWPEGDWGSLRCLAAGLALGAAFWLKYNAVVFFPFLLVLPFLAYRELDPPLRRIRLVVPWQDWFGRLLIVGTGFGLVVAGVLTYFRIAGAWPALKEVQFEVLPRYRAMAFGITTNNFLVWALRQTQNQVGIWTEAGTALALLIAWWRRELKAIAPIALLALAGYLSVAAQVRMNHWYYYETCYPFFEIIWGYLCVKTYEGFQFLRLKFAQRGLTVARALLWLVLGGLAWSLLPEEAVRIVQQYNLLMDWRRNPELSYMTYWWQLPLERLQGQIHVVNFLKVHSEPRDKVYVWGTAPLINLLSQRQCPSRFVSNLAVISVWGPERWRLELASTLEKKRPLYIVVARYDAMPGITFTGLDSEQYLRVYPALSDVLHRNYQTDVNFGDFQLYRLK